MPKAYLVRSAERACDKRDFYDEKGDLPAKKDDFSDENEAENQFYISLDSNTRYLYSRRPLLAAASCSRPPIRLLPERDDNRLCGYYLSGTYATKTTLPRIL
ncbi:uncharacterized protein MYCFIDRAFT_84742 [Pseudocercospora fijiensis CIRAD86]|uniref:Uncharacterized protein n=1 Tax=Pseudocercospora fijiensis (strain CIRAD86) TaxID=383855 RepID=M2ZXL6_PSEFD|nr:uncharacterized protein MYCFIDRAFT_84742 [Pseudocercospora fijiensis CIRAD86]EME76836.1 hypothetical protein MYCFIDRAFT_84742 [Pseudocercospora fijiensis CIRAD86]